MATQAEIADFQQSLDDLSAVALADFVTAWDSLDLADPAKATGVARDGFAATVERFWPMSAELGALWFEQLRTAADPTRPHETSLARFAGIDAVQDTLSWSAAPLFADNPAPDQALARFGMTLQRQVLMPARETVQQNVATDPAHPRWARHASANACAFCALLATRGATYRTEESAGLASKYHPHCHCVPVAVWPGQDYQPAPYVADWEAAYKQATHGGASDTSAVLANMRQILGAA